MRRINTNVQSLVAQRVLNTQNAALGRSLQRLSTGLRINSGADDPAGLIVSEGLRAEKAALGVAIENARRAESVVSVAEGSLQEVSTLLLELEDLVDRSANDAAVSADQVKANQLQIDSVLQSINRIADTATFDGKKLFDLGNRTDGFLTSLGSGQANDLAGKNFAVAQRVVRAAQVQISRLRGRIGAFQKDTLATSVNSLLVTLENTTAAESAIRDADFAAETSALTRAQILVNASTFTLWTANQIPQQGFQLLG